MAFIISDRLYNVLNEGFYFKDMAFMDVKELCESCELGRDFQHMIVINRVEDQKCERYEVPTFCFNTIKEEIEYKKSSKGEDRFVLPLTVNWKKLCKYRALGKVENTFLKVITKLWLYNYTLDLKPIAIPNPDGLEPILFYGTQGMICDQDMNPLILCTANLFKKKILTNNPGSEVIYDTGVHAGTSHCYVHPRVMKEDNILYKGLRTKFIPAFCDRADTDIILGDHPMLHCVKHCSTPGLVTPDMQESLVYKCLNAYLDEILDQFPEYNNLDQEVV